MMENKFLIYRKFTSRIQTDSDERTSYFEKTGGNFKKTPTDASLHGNSALCVIVRSVFTLANSEALRQMVRDPSPIVLQWLWS